MKVKDFFKTLVAGIAMGISSAIPAVSAGTVAVIFKVYDKFLWSVSHILKEFKKAIIILIPIIIGLLIGLIPTIILVDKALHGFIFGLVCIFAGLIIGSIPQVTPEIKGGKPNKAHIIVFTISFLIVIALGVGSVFAKTDATYYFDTKPWFLYAMMLPIGFVAASALVIPGISGSMIMILLGCYKPLIDSTVQVGKEALSGNWTNVGPQLGVLLCFLVGILVGFFFTSKIMNRCLTKYRKTTFYGILGFIIASILVIFFNNDIFEYYKMWASGQHGFLSMNAELIVGAILLVVFAVISYLLVRLVQKREKEAKPSQQDVK